MRCILEVCLLCVDFRSISRLVYVCVHIHWKCVFLNAISVRFSHLKTTEGDCCLCMKRFHMYDDTIRMNYKVFGWNIFNSFSIRSCRIQHCRIIKFPFYSVGTEKSYVASLMHQGSSVWLGQRLKPATNRVASIKERIDRATMSMVEWVSIFWKCTKETAHRPGKNSHCAANFP